MECGEVAEKKFKALDGRAQARLNALASMSELTGSL